MDQYNWLDVLGQASVREAGEIVGEYMRGGVRTMLEQVMAAEVAELRGEKYRLNEEATNRRAGGAAGYVVWEGNRENVTRPRARRDQDDGMTKEVGLRRYEAARQLDHLQAMVLRALRAGVSSRDLGTQDWLVLMLDGIVLSKEHTVIVAIGVASDRTNRVLDFDLGSTENCEVFRDLVRRLLERSFAPTRRLLAVLDGSPALKKAVLHFFPEAVIQRCPVHKERKIRVRLSKRD